jgi:cell division protein FtsB
LKERQVPAVIATIADEFVDQSQDAATFAAELALLGSVLTTAGDLFSTFSAAIALRQIYIDNAKAQQDQEKQEKQIKDIQDQITALKEEIKALRGK